MKPKLTKTFFAGVLSVAFASGFSYGHFVEGTKGENSPFDSAMKKTVDENRFEVVEVKAPVVSDRAFLEQVEKKNPVPVRKTGSTNLYLSSPHSAVIIDSESKLVLYGKNEKQRRQVASLTKTMTALLAAEQTETFDQVVTIKPEMLQVDGTVVGCPRTGYCNSNRLVAGEKIRLNDLMQAMLMNSANDAATAIAVHLGGSMDNFVRMMNKRAEELGLRDTHFCTPSGLEIDGRESECYSTAYDMARIATETLKYPELWNMMNHPPVEIASLDGKRTHKVITTNQLIDQYPGLLGTKTGFTPLAGHSLLASAQDSSGKHKIVAVLLDDESRWSNVQTMFTWTFANHTWEE